MMLGWWACFPPRLDGVREERRRVRRMDDRERLWDGFLALVETVEMDTSASSLRRARYVVESVVMVLARASS